MGCDIHLAVEVRRNGRWERALPPPEAYDPWLKEQATKPGRLAGASWVQTRLRTTWYDDRNYSLFAMLADVRNGGGVFLAGAHYEPIAPPRGLPRDLSDDVRRLAGESGLLSETETDDDGAPIPDDDTVDSDDIWLGDHSHSWHTVAQLDAYDWAQRTISTGVIPWERWKAWSRKPLAERGTPDSYSGAIGGRHVVTIAEADAELRLVSGWEPTAPIQYYVQATWEESYAHDAGRFYSQILPILRTLGAPDDVRIVFGFDS